MPASLQILPEPEDWIAPAMPHGHEHELCPLAGIEESDSELHISTCVCETEGTVRVHVAPRTILIESCGRNSLVPLPAAVRQDSARAKLHDHDLDLFVRKAA